MSNSNSHVPPPALPLIARILMGAPFILSGVGKLGNPAGIQGYIASIGVPLPMIAYLIAVAVEIGAGLMLVIGFRARWASVALAVFTVIAAVLFHRNLGDQNQFIHFMKNLAWAGGLLGIAAYGPGRFSLDNRRLEAPGQIRTA